MLGHISELVATQWLHLTRLLFRAILDLATLETQSPALIFDACSSSLNFAICTFVSLLVEVFLALPGFPRVPFIHLFIYSFVLNSQELCPPQLVILNIV
jgi:hypothetical protein